MTYAVGVVARFDNRGQGMIRYLPCAVFLACGLVIASEAAAIEVTVGQTKLVLVAPKGFCPFDRRHSRDSQLIDIMQQATQGDKEVLGTFADCRRLKSWRAGITNELGGIFHYAVSLKAKNRDASALIDIPTMCATFRQQGVNIVKNAERATAERIDEIKELAGKIELNSMQMYGVLHEDSTGCYLGTVQKVRIEDSVETMFNVNVLTVIKRKMIFAVHEGDFKDETIVQRSLAISRKTVAAMLARNR